MMAPFSNRERTWLIVTAIVGGIGLNGAFVYGVMQPDIIADAIRNPIAAAFILEAFVLVGLLAYLVHRCRASRLRWPWLVGLSLLGGLAFALPVVLLWGGRSDQQGSSEASEPIERS
jgi:peptidoglycan/LPS O-acetylase OafA/YrhL